MKWESQRQLAPVLSRVDSGMAGGGQSLSERGGSLVWEWQEQVREPPRMSERASEPTGEASGGTDGLWGVVERRVSLR